MEISTGVIGGCLVLVAFIFIISTSHKDKIKKDFIFALICVALLTWLELYLRFAEPDELITMKDDNMQNVCGNYVYWSSDNSVNELHFFRLMDDGITIEDVSTSNCKIVQTKENVYRYKEKVVRVNFLCFYRTKTQYTLYIPENSATIE